MSTGAVRSSGARAALLDLHRAHKAFTEIRGYATQPVMGEGPLNAPVMFVGEAPGYEEDRRGRPFVGPSGQILGRWFRALGVDRGSVYVTNVLKYRPPGNRVPSATERHAARPLLAAEIAMVAPNLVVLLGATALGTVFPGRGLPGHRGRILRGNHRDYLPTYHPAVCLRQPELTRVAEQDLGQIAGYL